MDANLVLILIVIILAYIFDFTNGFHDAANSIATIVSTEVLTPRQAVIWAAFFNFVAFLFFKLSVAKTIGIGLINPSIVDPFLLLSVLFSAIIWNLITWYYGLPSSSSHALIGGLAGAAYIKGGLAVLELSGFAKVLVAIILSPLLGLSLGLIFMLIISRLTQGFSNKTNHLWFKNFQLISAALLSLTHGGNDAQKTMGIIAILLYSGSLIGPEFYIPLWVVISCNLVIALGTLAGGWRIVNTMGKQITKLNTMRGCCAESAAAVVIYTATHYGIPISTTHTITGSIAGVGLSKSFWGTEWSVMRKIFMTWLITIPATSTVAGLIMLMRLKFFV